MESRNIYILAKKHLKTAILAGLLLGAVSFIFLIVSQKSFKASTDILVVQNQEGTVDYYAMSRSADYLTNILSQAVYSEKFLDETITTGKISANIFSSDPLEKRKAWQEIISIQKSATTGILSVQVFSDTARSAKDISDGVLEVLINKNAMFLGTNQNLKIQILSGPIVEKNPSIAQLILASLGGFLIGMILAFIFGIYRSQMETIKQDNRIEFYHNDKKNHANQEIYPIEKADEEILSDENYMSADSDYWKERLNNE
jgi:capsular polysaccharide biosynthesis protein